MNTLNLRNLFATYYKVNKAKVNEIYYSEHNNNMIVFTPLDKTVDTESICNGIGGARYQYLMNEMNTKKNIIVHWTQIEGTTSDYDIFYDFDPSTFIRCSHSKICETLANATKDSNTMKYNSIINGRLEPIIFTEIEEVR